VAVVSISSRGHILIPGEIRKKLHIVPGKKILLRVEGDRLVLVPLPDDPVEQFCGVFKSGPSLTKALLKERRKDLNQEEENTAR